MITIIVLLILAGVSIATLTGQNGILTQAENAKTQAGIGEEKEAIGLAYNGAKTEKLGGEITADDLNSQFTKNGVNATASGSGTIKVKFPDTGRSYKIDNNGNVTESVKMKQIAVNENAIENSTINGEEGSYDNPVIPKGFKAVNVGTAVWGTADGYQNGLVIEDATGDTTTNGSQFVWVPVEDYDNNFHLIEGYYDGTLVYMLDPEENDNNPSREAGSNNTMPYAPGKPNVENTTVGTEESIEMYKSVKDNGGFYIARYEAGINGTTVSTITDDENKQTQNGTVKPVSKANVGVWNCISWGGTSSNTSPKDGLPGDDTQDGAVKVARSMYNNLYTGNKNTNTTVKSTLCYGVQWDAVMNFIDSSYVDMDGNATGYVKDSTNKGNYSGTIATTGSNDNYAVKNIYDMAGNVYEWTMEAFNTDYRLYRGGEYDDSGSGRPASVRLADIPDSSYSGVGLRVTLYL